MAGMTFDTRHFGEELDSLKRRMLEMGALAEDKVRLAMQALVQRDQKLIAEIAAGDAAINQLHL
jgi:phosphate transport system protein